MKKLYVEKLKWLTDEEMLDVTTIAQSSPGAIAVNASIMLGYKLAGIAGAFFSMLGTIIPPLVILSIVSYLYSLIRDNAVISAIMVGMQAGIAAIICDVVISLTISVKKEKNIFAYFIMPIAFVLTFFFKINVLYVILACIVLGIVLTIIEEKKLSKKAETTETPQDAAQKKESSNSSETTINDSNDISDCSDDIGNASDVTTNNIDKDINKSVNITYNSTNSVNNTDTPDNNSENNCSDSNNPQNKSDDIDNNLDCSKNDSDNATTDTNEEKHDKEEKL